MEQRTKQEQTQGLEIGGSPRERRAGLQTMFPKLAWLLGKSQTAL